MNKVTIKWKQTRMKTLKLYREEGADGFIIMGNLYSEKAIVIPLEQ